MIACYEMDLEVRNYKKNTRRRIIQMVERFLFCTCTPESITPKIAEEYFTGLYKMGRTIKTIDNNRSAVKGFFEYLITHGVVNRNPIPRTRRIERAERLPAYLPDEEIELVYRLAEQEGITNEIIIALNTGLRMNELRYLEWRDIEFQNRQLIVRGDHTKNGKTRTVPLNKKALAALQEQREKFPVLDFVFPGGGGGNGGRGLWTENRARSYKWWLRLSLQNIRDQIPTVAKIPKGTVGRGWHIFRHTFATKLARAGVEIHKIKDWLGHSNIQTTLRYVHLARHYDADIELII